MSKTTTQPAKGKETFTITENDKTVTFYGNEDNCRDEYDNEYPTFESETFFEWCMKKYPVATPSTPIQDIQGHTPGEGICTNCGAHAELHHYETNQCPKNGVEAKWDKKQEWGNTIFESLHERELIASAPQLKAENTLLKDLLKEVFNEYKKDGNISVNLLAQYLVFSKHQ